MSCLGSEEGDERERGEGMKGGGGGGGSESWLVGE